mgnify:CR=1 FL=1
MKAGVISDREMRAINSGEVEVQIVRCTADEARALCDEVSDETLMEAIDTTQGPVFNGDAKVAYVVLKIVGA